jgi:hypothetical protein
MNTLETFKKELEPYKDTLVISDFDAVVRLVDVIDGEEDYYWVYDTYKGIVNASCVCGWIPLKGFIPEDDYNRLKNVWNLNNIEKCK